MNNVKITKSSWDGRPPMQYVHYFRGSWQLRESASDMQSLSDQWVADTTPITVEGLPEFRAYRGANKLGLYVAIDVGNRSKSEINLLFASRGLLANPQDIDSNGNHIRW